MSGSGIIRQHHIFAFLLFGSILFSGCGAPAPQNEETEAPSSLSKLCPSLSELPYGFSIDKSGDMWKVAAKDEDSAVDKIFALGFGKLASSIGLEAYVCAYAREKGSETADRLAIIILKADDSETALSAYAPMSKKRKGAIEFDVGNFADQSEGFYASDGDVSIAFQKSNYAVMVTSTFGKKETVEIAKAIAGKIPNPEGIYYTSPKDACPRGMELPEGYALANEVDLTDTLISNVISNGDFSVDEAEMLGDLNKNGNVVFYACQYGTSHGGKFNIFILKVPESLVGEIDFTTQMMESQFKEEGADNNLSEFYVEKFTNETQGMRGYYEDGGRLTAVSFRKGNYKSIVKGDLDEEGTVRIAKIVASRIK